MKNKGFLLFLYWATFCAYGQNESFKELKGQVYSPDNDVVGVVVQNITTQQAVITDEAGYFSIPVQRYDTLVFTAVQLKSKRFFVDEALYNTSFLRVTLEALVNELDEVVVQPYNLSGNLDSDAALVTPGSVVSAETLALPNAGVKVITQSERKLQEASDMRVTGGGGLGGVGGAVALNPLINAITGRTKMLKNRVAVDNTYAQTRRIQHFYTDTLLITALKIPKDHIANFMYFCELDAQFQAIVALRDRLKLWDFMRKKSEVYRKNNHLE